MLGLLLSPLLHGSVDPEGQCVVADLFAVSFFLLRHRLGEPGSLRPVGPPGWGWLVGLALVLPLVPLPLAWVEALSPARAALAREFPIHSGEMPAWLTLSISPAASLQRLGECALLLAAFRLARGGAGQGHGRSLARFIGVTLLLLAGTDIWFRLDSQRLLLGLWPDPAGHAAGTFANRNHFAGWISAAALFSFGWILRNVWPIQSVRLHPLSSRRRWVGDALFLLAATLLSLAMAVATGSRGGLISLVAGVAGWGFALAHRSRNKTRWVVLQAVGVLVFLTLLASGDSVLDRLTAMRGDTSFKLDIWRNAVRLFGAFPWFGTGWGTFAIGFNHFKQFGGENTFLHAENDYLQLLVEGGIVGGMIVLLTLGQLARAAWQFAGRSSVAEPELVFGALAALAAVAVHAVGEFVFQITANALLASVLLGFIIGCRDHAAAPVVPEPVPTPRALLNLGWALAWLAWAGWQGGALVLFEQGRRAGPGSAGVERLRQSVQLWPGAARRQIALARAEVRRMQDLAAPSGEPPWEEIERVRGQLDFALAWSPFDWELRLERTWYDVAFSSHTPRRAELWEMVKLNPLQPQIPLGFARHFARTDPALALELVRAVPPSSAKYQRETLELAWELTGDTEVLWSLTRGASPSWQALGDVAVEQGLFGLAAQAYLQLTNHVTPTWLAEKLLQAHRPDLALDVLPKRAGSLETRLLLSRAYAETGRFTEAIRLAESCWLESKARDEILLPRLNKRSRERGRSGSAHVDDRAVARGLAEEIYRNPPARRDVARLRSLAGRCDDLRLRWILFRTEMDQDRAADAAQTALEIAVRAAALDR